MSPGRLNALPSRRFHRIQTSSPRSDPVGVSASSGGYFLIEVAGALALFAVAASAFLHTSLAASDAMGLAMTTTHMNSVLDNLEEAVRAAPIDQSPDRAGRPDLTGSPADHLVSVSDQPDTWGEKTIDLLDPSTSAPRSVIVSLLWLQPQPVFGSLRRYTVRVAVRMPNRRPPRGTPVDLQPKPELRFERTITRSF